jgi:hypothetical protein
MRSERFSLFRIEGLLRRGYRHSFSPSPSRFKLALQRISASDMGANVHQNWIDLPAALVGLCAKQADLPGNLSRRAVIFPLNCGAGYTFSAQSMLD